MVISMLKEGNVVEVQHRPLSLPGEWMEMIQSQHKRQLEVERNREEGLSRAVSPLIARLKFIHLPPFHSGDGQGFEGFTLRQRVSNNRGQVSAKKLNLNTPFLKSMIYGVRWARVRPMKYMIAWKVDDFIPWF